TFAVRHAGTPVKWQAAPAIAVHHRRHRIEDRSEIVDRLLVGDEQRAHEPAGLAAERGIVAHAEKQLAHRIRYRARDLQPVPHERLLDSRVGVEDRSRAIEVVIGQARLQRSEILDRIEASRRKIDRDRKTPAAAEIERRKPGTARERLPRLEALDQLLRRLLELDPDEFRLGREASAAREYVPD